MATVSERSRELAIDIEEQCCAGDYVFVGSEAAKLIEQALLAERRLAMEEAEQIVRDTFGAKTRFIQALRAAAEKEVSNGD